MKYFVCVTLVFFSLPLFALDGAETIAPKTRIIKSLSWYSDQADRWEEKVRQEPANADAWLNFYAASRYSQKSLASLSSIASQAQKVISGTFEAKLIQALNEGYSENSMKLLMEAYAMKPQQSATYGPLMLANEIRMNTADRKEFGSKLLSSGQVSQALLSYSYNVLMSIESSAVLFIDGDNTTLPLFILQDVMNVRKDVTVLSLDLLTSEAYRTQKLKNSSLEFSLGSGDEDIKKMICSGLPEQNPSKKFYYALTIGGNNISSINNELYVVGLASQHSKARLDNISVIKENLEKRFMLDYLRVDFNGENEFSAGKVMSSNYLISMLLLNDHYVKTGELGKAEELKKLVAKIAAETGKQALVENFLHREEEVPLAPPVIISLDLKKMEVSLRQVKDNLYAYNTEVTNAQYNLFLNYLKTNHLTDTYEKAKIDLSQYDKTSQAFFNGYHTYLDPAIKTRGSVTQRTNFRNYPAVNISYEGAIAYCEWLTEQYNGNADRKYKKVKFRLPTVKEWQIAALGYVDFASWNLDENTVKVTIPPPGNEDEIVKGKETVIPVDNTVLYPWFKAYNYRNKAQNRRNCFLGNFKAPEDCKPCASPSVGMDGYSMMGPVASYFPNGMGLFDVVGNVAEMTEEKGRAAGGSWNHSPDESTIRSINEYKGPDATIGFRIFMDIIEK
ncbi:MAG: SUMF1/EgtB/PvdO family nonheme iron enzyme [Cyclobacteriaceae bacterium]|nr:SUMF1/EgtB/PvdO family nonheme iron enzyme [Cyclobacteriaceae bacterium]